jgi:hypothetical protein
VAFDGSRLAGVGRPFSDETRVEEAVSTLARLLTKAIKDAKARHGPSKRVRVFLTLDTPLSGIPAGDLGPQAGDLP